MTPEDQDRLAELQEHLIYNDPLYKDGFQAGAASRDAEIAALKTTPAHMRQDLHCVVSDIAQQVRDAEKENDQLREQVRMLREALLTCSAGDFSTGHVIYPSFDEKLVEEALAATEPKKGASQKPAPHACRNTETTSI